ncbi:MAG: iron-containing alcohol dehydrogenase family protein [bacterium]|nr:iron-containing alcohol dehydrogenase family protein [bacterium]
MMQHRIIKQVPRMLFGAGALGRLNELLPAKNGAKDWYLYVVDEVHRTTGLLDRLDLKPEDKLYTISTAKEPTTVQVDELRDLVLKENENRPAAVISLGGGSTMDVGKATAVMLNNEGSSAQYQGWDLVPNPAVFKVGIPTLAGTGAEASRTAVLTGPEKKFGINSDHSMFDAIVLDPELSGTVPAEQRFYTAMDCYIHCVESLRGTMINEIAAAYASKALEMCQTVFLSKGEEDKLMVASYMGGLSIVNSEVGICHALSYGLSLILGYRHGIANCIAFNVLEEYYDEHVVEMREMMKREGVTLPTNVCAGLKPEELEAMVDMTLRMERPLTNALGENYKDILTKEKIRELYANM